MKGMERQRSIISWTERQALALAPHPLVFVPPRAPSHLLAGGDKGEVLLQGRGSRCTGLWRHKTWQTLWESLAEKGHCSSQNADQTYLRSQWPTRSCPSESRLCILEGPPCPAVQLRKHRV